MPLSQLLKSSNVELKAELQLILNAVVEGLCGLDANGRTTFCNDALLKMTGYQAEEFIGNNLHELLHHSRPDGTKYPIEECAFHNAMKAGEAIHIAVESFWRKDGTCFPVEYSMRPLHQPHSLSEFVVTIQDITVTQEAKDVLRQSENKFRRILASVPDVVWTSDRQGRTIYVSAKVEEIFGYSAKEICGGGELRMGCIHPEDFARVNRSYRSLFDSQSAFDEEYRIRRRDGAWIWIHDRAEGTYLEKGSFYATGVFSDVTRRKNAEAGLKSQTAFLEAQANSTIDGILVVDGRNRRLLLNQRFIELFKVPPEVVADTDDRHMLEYVCARLKDPESFLARVQYLYKNPTETGRDEIEFKDGMILDRYSSPVVDKEGNYYGRIWTFRDITERKRNEDRLQQLSTVVEQSPASVFITDPQGNITYVNHKFTETSGYSPEDVIGKNPSILKSGQPSSQNPWSNITQGREWRGEVCSKKKNGEHYWEAETVTPIKNAKGAITHFLAIKEGITERRRAEMELRRSEAYLSEAQRVSHIGSWAWSVAKKEIIFWSEEHYRIFGMKPDDGPVSMLQVEARIHPEDLPLFRTLFDESAVEGSDHEADLRIVRPDGSLRNVHSTSHPVVDDLGRRVEFVGTCMDVTERQQAETELYRSRQMLQTILDAIPQRVFWKDQNSVYLGCNRALATDAGLNDPAEIVGKSDLDFSWAEMADLYRADDKLVMDEGEAKLNFHEQLKTPGGNLMWVQTNKLPLRDMKGDVTGVLGTYEDITERKRAEKELWLAQFSLEHASDAIFRIGPEGNIVYVNSEACRSYGRPREELLSLTIPDIDPLFPKEAWTKFWGEIKTRGSMTLETLNQTKDGRIFPVEVAANFLELEGQEYVFSFVRDISERRVLEGKLRQAQKLEGIGQLAAGIAHEINTPTQFVTDNLTFLDESWKSTHELLQQYRSAICTVRETLAPAVMAALAEAEQHCDLDFIVAEVPHAIEQSLDGTRRVAKIIRAMKEFSHPDSVEKAPTDLNRAIESTITVARNEWKYVAEITTEFDETLPPIVCYAGDINQVVLNLLVNAAHAIKETAVEAEMGRITVRTRRRDDFAEISVTDTGTGIPEAIHARIFDPFFTTKEVGKGTGQGLSIAHGMIVKKHGGKIWFDTKFGHGTTFFIALPINPVTYEKEK
jgi:two-component system, NtrC family, sensor kinase